MVYLYNVQLHAAPNLLLGQLTLKWSQSRSPRPSHPPALSEVSKGLNVESCHKITWSFACMADKEQVEKFLLMEPPAMIPTFLPVQDLNLGSYKDFRNCFTCIELNLHHRDRPQNCALFREQGCSPWCQGHHPPGGTHMN